ncbi:MAG: hypothetical protein GXP09_07230 [Gammaproteobacteria bacterium]|nr:hypothetical protein [Gammaproteobacteria bacterium]
MQKNIKLITITAISVLLLAPDSYAGGVTIKDGDKYLKMGGRIQIQYYQNDADNKESADKIFFRRFRPYIEGSIHKNWKGKFQWDMGKAEDGNEIAVKDAYLQYKGFTNKKLTIGNKKTPFSQEFLTSSKKQQLVERTFVGDHNYGTPDRMLGIFLDGHSSDKNITYSLALGNGNIDPDAKKLDFDTPANDRSDWNQGRTIAARVDYFPLGHYKFSQGDFKRKTRANIGIGAFSWNNDGDNNTYTSASGSSSNAKKADVDSVTGFEISGALRGGGFSVDAAYNVFNADTVDPAFTGGIFKSGSTELKNWAVEGGYMMVPSKFELVAGYQAQDADNYAKQWTRTSLGANWYIAKHDIKVQLSYRVGRNTNGKAGSDRDEVFLQTQYVF